MTNSINLHDSQKFYSVTHQGKKYNCNRVSDVIEQTSPTPIYLKMWMVNCATEILNGKNLINHDLKITKKLAWAAHQVKSQQALDVGTNVHGMIKSGAFQESKGDEESKACWEAYQEFTKAYVPVAIVQELSLYDINNLIAGTTDWIGILSTLPINKKQKKTIHILDWKTSKAINHDYKVQVVIYKHMLQCLIKLYKKNPSLFSFSNSKILNDIILAAGTNPKIKCGVVRLNKNPNARKLYEFVELTAKEEKDCLKEFKLMIQLFNHRKENHNGNAYGG